jgi:molybdopterin synthase catalytic subunit
MAFDQMNILRDDIFNKYELSCMHIFHSLGLVNAGDISLFVFVSSKHRRIAFDACEEVVELVKSKLPIWGKEIFHDNSYNWKVNH